MEQKITILNKRHEKLIGVLHEAGSTKIVVLCHGFRSSKVGELWFYYFMHFCFLFSSFSCLFSIHIIVPYNVLFSLNKNVNSMACLFYTMAVKVGILIKNIEGV